MERIEKSVVEQPAWPEDVREKIERAVQKPHEAQLVFGIVGASNITFAGDELFFTNFDGDGPLLMYHDQFMLNWLFSAE